MGGKVVRQITTNKNLVEKNVVDIPSLPSLPGSGYSKSGECAPAASKSGSAPSISLPSFSFPSFSAPSVSIDAPSIELSGSADGKTQAIAVLGAEVVAAGLATATVGSLTKE